MSTKVYGHSDDCIEFDGDVRGERYLGRDGKSRLVFSDGTHLEISYQDSGTWVIALITKGSLFDRIDKCSGDSTDDAYSDVAHFRSGLIAATCDGKEVS